MLVIRLRRVGKRQHATYRFVVSEKSRTPRSTVLEFLGSYNPHTNPPTVNLNRDRITHWLQVGAQPSQTVHNLLVDAGLVSGPKVRVARIKKKIEAAAKPESAVPAKEGQPAAVESS